MILVNCCRDNCSDADRDCLMHFTYNEKGLEASVSPKTVIRVNWSQKKKKKKTLKA